MRGDEIPTLEGALETRLLDPGAFVRLREWGGDTLVGKMVELFLKNAPERLEEVREGLEGRDAHRAERGAHSLKSSAGNMGAERLRILCQLTENAAEDEDLDRVRELFPHLELALEQTLGGLRRHATPPSPEADAGDPT
jgi:HPt (histidine-containing phosphotransfer) domain-containing protein